MTAMPSPLALVVDVDEPPVVGGDLLGGVLPREVAVDEPLQRVPPDRTTDREPDVAGHARAGPQPVVDRRVVRAAAQDDAHAAIAPAPAHGGRDRLAVLAPGEALDLPDVRLDAGLLQLADRGVHELRARLPVPVLLAARGLDLLGRGRDQQLEQERAVVLVQPVAQALEPRGLPN